MADKEAKKGKTAKEYEEAIRAYDSRGELVKLWEAIKGGKPLPDWEDGKAFEYMVVRAFEIENLDVVYPYNVTWPSKVGTAEQIDGIVTLDGRRFLLESKHYMENMGIDPIAKLRLRLSGRPPGTMGVVFCVKGFSMPTQMITQFLEPLNIILWSGEDFDHALRGVSMTTSLRRKMEIAVVRGLPHYAIGGA